MAADRVSALTKWMRGAGGDCAYADSVTSLGPGIGTVHEVSAGGIVVDKGHPDGSGAVIARLNRAGRVEWCLPKGHLEGGETVAEAAVREVAEETGIVGEILESLGAIDYWFFAEGRRIHKVVHLFLMLAVDGSITVDNDPDREAIDAAWVPLAELDSRLTFPNERRVAREARARLAPTRA